MLSCLAAVVELDVCALEPRLQAPFGRRRHHVAIKNSGAVALWPRLQELRHRAVLAFESALEQTSSLLSFVSSCLKASNSVKLSRFKGKKSSLEAAAKEEVPEALAGRVLRAAQDVHLVAMPLCVATEAAELRGEAALEGWIAHLGALLHQDALHLLFIVSSSPIHIVFRCHSDVFLLDGIYVNSSGL